MISLTGKPGDAHCKIRFSPRPGFKKKYDTIERDLVYGHYCPKCMNVVDALFMTDEPVDLWPYEETHVISTSADEKKNGTILRIVPNVESKFGYTNYNVTPCLWGDKVGKGQHIALKNHVLKYHGIEAEKHTSDRYFEPGDRTCEYTGVFARLDHLLMKDLCHFMRLPVSDMENYNMPPVDEFLKLATSYDFRALPAYGQAPPIVVFPRQKMVDNYGYAWQMRNILQPFMKPKQQKGA